MTEEIYQFVLLFFFRVPRRDRNHNYLPANVQHWIFSDDRAQGHKSCYYWIKHFLHTIEGIYQPICPNVTSIVQVADDPLCNGYYKACIRREGRTFMRQEIIKGLDNKHEKKKVIPKLGSQEMDKVLSIVYDRMNGERGISNVRKAFMRKLDPNKYDKRLKDNIALWNKIKDKPPQSQQNKLFLLHPPQNLVIFVRVRSPYYL
eukprot:736164_1